MKIETIQENEITAKCGFCGNELTGGPLVRVGDKVVHGNSCLRRMGTALLNKFVELNPPGWKEQNADSQT